MRFRDIRKIHRRRIYVVFQDFAAKLNALAADVDARPRDNPVHLILRFAAKMSTSRCLFRQILPFLYLTSLEG